jgi:hypothetical protein
LLGDAILAFFGAPLAHEDDPVRAVRASLDVLTVVREYAEEVRRKHGIDFAMRVGLNTGPVVVGQVGSDYRYEYTAMGDAVNLAARMQSAARPMTVLISEHTYRFVAPVFECVDLGQIEVKGKAEPVRVYEVAAAKAAPGKLRGLAGLESPMVGRDAELQRCSRPRAAVQAGLGRAVIIAARPGWARHASFQNGKPPPPPTVGAFNCLRLGRRHRPRSAPLRPSNGPRAIASPMVRASPIISCSTFCAHSSACLLPRAMMRLTPRSERVPTTSLAGTRSTCILTSRICC